MVKRFLVVAILLELGAFWYIHQSKEALTISNIPGKLLHEDLTKNVPTVVSIDDQTESAIEVSGNISNLTEVKEKYRLAFQELEDETKGKIKELVNKVKEDYEESDGIAVFLSVGSYYTEFKELEKQTDANFEKLYAQLEDELTTNGFSKTEGEEFRKQYEEKKQALYTKFIDKYF